MLLCLFFGHLPDMNACKHFFFIKSILHHLLSPNFFYLLVIFAFHSRVDIGGWQYREPYRSSRPGVAREVESDFFQPMYRIPHKVLKTQVYLVILSFIMLRV